MEAFTHYKIKETDDGFEVILYLDENLTEFSDELGTVPKMKESDIEKEAVSYVKRLLPSLKVKSVKIMAGAMLLTSLAFGAVTDHQVAAAESPVNQTQSLSSYTVSAGDTLYGIAKRTGTTVDAIKQANQLSSNVIQVGQTLTIPTSATSNPTQASGTTYQVVSGDTLYGIAARNGTTVDAIKQANQLSSNLLQVGQTLTIPGTASSPMPTDTTLSSPTKQTEQQEDLNQEEVEWLAKMIYSEGRGESLEGQIAIGAVIMNRVESPIFPNNVKDVLFEKSYGYYQFTPAETGAINNATPNAQNIEAAERAIQGEDPTNGALFFYNPDKTSSSYLKSRTVSTIIGNHTFAF
ncbi:LysM peptidoglycan-binding domain-containing protein [Aquibacillus sediminis]|uniref:LysM peptidoglycan-binding domain-containing protein n=1 Tax=Aquibacillus sediminis TaxID=2574734 RepID=UPI001108E9E9|nr:LysM peptidoglycan-binding domain-containing protein [Aquibacillus sediminis]